MSNDQEFEEFERIYAEYVRMPRKQGSDYLRRVTDGWDLDRMCRLVVHMKKQRDSVEKQLVAIKQEQP